MENSRKLVTSRTTIIKKSFNIKTQPKSENNRTKIMKKSFNSETLKKNFQSLKIFLLNLHEKINQNSDDQIKINNKKSLETKIQKQKNSSDEIPSQSSQLYESLIL